MNHVEACLSAIEDRESSFNHFGSTMRLVQPVYVRETLDNAVLTSEGML